MTELEIIATHRMEDGTEYRACLTRDAEPGTPSDNDGAWPILRVEYKHFDYVAEAFNRQAEPYVDVFNELFERTRELRNWERFVKMFRGATAVHEYGFNRGTDYAYIAFDPAEWRESMGVEAEQMADEKPLSEVIAWIEGDVYGRIVHARRNPDSNLEEDEGWYTFEDGYWLWGFFGHEYAVEAAKEALEDAVKRHKVVHRYTEHEKIDPVKQEIDAILGFLETLDQDDMCLARIFEDNHNHLQRIPESRHQRVVFEHFGISYNKIEEERELMFQRLREQAEEATDK